MSRAKFQRHDTVSTVTYVSLHETTRFVSSKWNNITVRPTD